MSGLLVTKLARARARLRLINERGQPSRSEAFTAEAQQLVAQGFALTVNGDCSADREAVGSLLCTPIYDRDGKMFASLTMQTEQGGAHLVLDQKALELMHEYLGQVLTVVVFENSQEDDNGEG